MVARPPGSPPPLTALVTCRNAAPTLGRLLEHLARNGATAIVVDHGSTDATREIAEAHADGPVAKIVEMPFDGVFDLGRQLRMKAGLIAGITDGWILHADADEFLDAPGGLTLVQHLAFWDAAPVVAFRADEFLFLPQAEGEVHKPTDFERTMTRYVPLAEVNPKQRIFRAGTPLDHWIATGGHTVTADPSQVAKEPLVMRHYFGLSLDQIRAEYLARVFDPRDLARLWHGSRRAADRFDIVPPPKDALQDATAGLDARDPVRLPPVFRPRDAPTGGLADGADLNVLALDTGLAGRVARTLEAALGGLRIGTGQRPAPGVPSLALRCHPSRGAPRDAAGGLAHAERWVRQVAETRQAALEPGTRIAETRIEDVEAAPGALGAQARALLLGSGPVGRAAFVRPDAPRHARTPFAGHLRAVAGPLARDLGYD